MSRSMDENERLRAAARLTAQGAYDEAIQEYQKLLEVDPKDFRVLRELGELYLKKKDKDTAGAAHFFTRVAESYRADGFLLKAVAFYKEALGFDPMSRDINRALMRLHQELGLKAEAESYALRANDAPHDEDREDRYPPGFFHARWPVPASQPAVAKPMPAATARVPQVRQPDNLHTDDWLREAERRSELEPGNGELARELAREYLQRGDPERAVARLQAALRFRDRDLETLGMLCRAFAQLGQHEKAREIQLKIDDITAGMFRV
jgi:pilus assembly protein FimV